MPTPTNVNSLATPADCLKIIETLENAGRLRAGDRALINSQFNGAVPYTPAEVEENQIQFNVNPLNGYKIAQDANGQVNGALLNKDKFFTVRCLKGDKEKREEWGQLFTDNIHRPMKRGTSGKKHLNLMKNRNASLTLHGIGAMLWMDDHRWIPRFVALEDLLIPVDATMDLNDELSHFAVNVRMTPWQLFKLTHGPAVQKGWNLEFVNKVLASIPVSAPFTQDLMYRPEEMESLWKQHADYMNSDAVPKVKTTFFFHQHAETGKWHRKILYRVTDGIPITAPECECFLFDSPTAFADNIEQILHVQFGDGNVVAPLKFHSVRGLGIMLYAIVEADTRMYCQVLQHTAEQLTPLLRIQDPTGKDRPKVIQLKPYGVLEDGVSFVPPNERSQADMSLVEFTMARNRQMIGESSSSYVQDIDTGTSKEQTLGEAQIKLQTANKIVGGMLSNMYLQEQFYYEEVVRRFLNNAPTDKDVLQFQERCVAAGIPKAILLDKDAWELDVEKVFGMGDQTLAIQEVTALMGIRQQLDPTAQRIIDRKYIATVTRNHDLARQLVPEQQVVGSAGRQAAEEVFATLMRGIPVSLREGIEQSDYVTAMCEMMAQEIARIKQTDDVGTPQDVIGLQTVAQDIGQHLQILAQDPSQKELVTGAGKALGKMMNEVKAFAQRQEEAAQNQQPEMDPEAIAKTQATIMQSQAKLQAEQEKTALKLQQSQAQHEQQMQQSQERHEQQMRQQAATTASQISQSEERTEAEIANSEAKTEATVAQGQQKTEADVALKAVKADGAKPKAKPEKEKPQVINLTVQMPPSNRTRLKFERDENGKITGATKETE